MPFHSIFDFVLDKSCRRVPFWLKAIFWHDFFSRLRSGSCFQRVPIFLFLQRTWRKKQFEEITVAIIWRIHATARNRGTYNQGNSACASTILCCMVKHHWRYLLAAFHKISDHVEILPRHKEPLFPQWRQYFRMCLPKYLGYKFLSTPEPSFRRVWTFHLSRTFLIFRSIARKQWKRNFLSNKNRGGAKKETTGWILVQRNEFVVLGSNPGASICEKWWRIQKWVFKISGLTISCKRRPTEGVK